LDGLITPASAACNSEDKGGNMSIPIVSIMVALILVALLWWVMTQLIVDAFLLKIARVVIVVLCVLYIVSLVTGAGPTIQFR
jgi:Ca2+/Na+ antiporter